MEEEVYVKKHKVRWILVVIIALIILYFIWARTMYYKECDTWDCFNERLESCKRTSFIGGNKMIFEYKIEGLVDGNCHVRTTLIQGELNNRDSQKLEGNEMVCKIPEGVVIVPESDIDNCNGILKEGLQDLILDKLHTYIVRNMGKINLDLLRNSSVEE
ncbi:MAG: hypothetical protein ACOCUT_03565 [bacterium]